VPWHHPGRSHRRSAGALLALVAALFTVAAAFHQHEIPELQRCGIAADHHQAVSTPLHDCLACRVAHSVATLDAALALSGPASALTTIIRPGAAPIPAAATATPGSPRGPPRLSLIRL
jgi:hypothetical protein